MASEESNRLEITPDIQSLLGVMQNRQQFEGEQWSDLTGIILVLC